MWGYYVSYFKWENYYKTFLLFKPQKKANLIKEKKNTSERFTFLPFSKKNDKFLTYIFFINHV